MHLLREGKFNVATTFVHETRPHNAIPLRSPGPGGEHEWEVRNEALHRQFSEMYHILDQLRQHHTLEPAISWAREHSAVLESRASNLEFELCKLQFLSSFLGLGGSNDIEMDVMERILRANLYAREAFGPFYNRYGPEIRKLVGSIPFYQNLSESPHGHLFAMDRIWDEVASSFTKEFCSLLGLSADSPLFIAATAGAIALPVLQKVKGIMRAKRTEWTTEEEMPVEISLPPSYSFHSIFVCPVSKEQATDANPPMMLPCGHVICNDSMLNASRGQRFKCPYCPAESHPRDAKKVFL
jgi:E3 ubiquitin-protein transferase RMND5